MTYHHTQYGALMPILLAALAIPALWVAFADPGPSAQWPLLAAAIMIVVLAWLFASLTVEVSEREIQWYFGPGLWTYRIARAELDGVAVVRNTWWDGFSDNRIDADGQRLLLTAEPISHPPEFAAVGLDQEMKATRIR